LELLNVDDLVPIPVTEELLEEKINKRKTGMEEKRLKVNMGNTNVMRCKGQSRSGGKHGKVSMQNL